MTSFPIPTWLDRPEKYQCIGGVGPWFVVVRTCRRSTNALWDAYLIQNEGNWHNFDLATTRTTDVHTRGLVWRNMKNVQNALATEDQGFVRLMLLIKLFAPHLLKGDLLQEVREALNDIERLTHA